MPNRIIKESIRTSKTINNLTDFQFRVWTYLITYVDDYGRGSADPEILKGFVFPRRKGLTESNIAKALADLAAVGSIVLYEVDGESYLYFPNWSEHQRIQTKKSKFPPPEEVKNESSEIHGDSPWVTVGHRESPSESESKSESKSESNPNIESKRAKARFTPPTLEEVRNYCKERNSTVDPERFVDFYAKKKWKIGGDNILDWKSVVRAWERKDREKHKFQSPNSGNIFANLVRSGELDE